MLNRMAVLGFGCALLAGGTAIAREKLQFHVQAVVVSDDDGQNRAQVTSRQLELWVARANHSFAEADVEFLFDPAGGDLEELRNSRLNRIEAHDRPLSPDDYKAAKAVAAKHPTKVVVIFRNGPPNRPATWGFANSEFAVLTSFHETDRCGEKHLSFLSHELGHYFGLPHTFKEQFQTVAEAEAWVKKMQQSGGDIDGDHIADTPPTPFIRKLACRAQEEVVLNGQRYRINRSNIMSYDGAEGGQQNRQTITAGQAAVVRQHAEALAKKIRAASKKGRGK